MQSKIQKQDSSPLPKKKEIKEAAAKRKSIEKNEKFFNLLTFTQNPELTELNGRMDAIMESRKAQKIAKLHQKLSKN